MNYWIGSLIFTIAFVTALSWIVYSRNKKRAVNRRFAVFAAALALWSCIDILLMSIKNVVDLLFLLKFAGILGALLPAAFIFFAAGFEIPVDGEETQGLKKVQILFFLTSIAASLITLHPSFIKEISIRENIQENLPGPDVVYGVPFIPYSLLIIISMFFGLRYLYRLMRRKAGVQKTEIQYIFLAIITGTIFAIGTTLIAPMFGTTALCRFGSMSSIIMCSIIAYAIARHRILNISVFAEKTFVYSCLIAGLMILYVFFVWTLSHFVRVFVPTESLLPVIFSSFIVAIAFSPLKEFIQNWAKKKIFKQHFDIEQIVVQMRLLIGSSFNLEEGISALTRIIKNEIGINKPPVFLIKSGEESARKIFMELKRNSIYRVEFRETSSILRLLESEPYTHFKDDLARFSSREIINSVITEMQQYDAEIVIPINFRNRTIGAVLLGAKDEQTSFSNAERRMLNVLASYTGIFIETMELAASLRESRSYQQSLLEGLPSGVIAVDDQDRVIVFNQEAERITGLNKENVLNHPYENVIPQKLQKLLKELFQNRTEFRDMEIEMSKNGTVVPIRVSGSCFYSPGGSLLGCQLIFSDISQLRILQRQLERNERLASLGILAAGIAHEIRNPLVALKTFSQLLPEKFYDQEFRSNYARVVIPEIERIDKLVDQLLVFAKPAPAKKEKINLVSVVESTLMLIETQKKFSNISFIKEYSDDTIEVMADPEKIKQALLNILLNSADALEDKENGFIKLRLENGKDNVFIRIQDNGCGISEENLKKIFEPLFTTKPDGTGLGLPIVNEIIAQHNGSINIESKQGAGTTVTVILPVNKGTEK